MPLVVALCIARREVALAAILPRRTGCCARPAKASDSSGVPGETAEAHGGTGQRECSRNSPHQAGRFLPWGRTPSCWRGRPVPSRGWLTLARGGCQWEGQRVVRPLCGACSGPSRTSWGSRDLPPPGWGPPWNPAIVAPEVVLRTCLVLFYRFPVTNLQSQVLMSDPRVTGMTELQK